MYKLSFYVPEDALEDVKTALFEAGAGKMGNYDSCCWQILGKGQFRALPGSQPALGELNTLETVAEWKVEMVCEAVLIKQAVVALKSAHPFEEVAYSVLQMVDPDTL